MSHKSVPQECPIRVSHKSVLQECPTRVSYKSGPQECPTRVSYKSVPEECPTRVSYKSVVWTYVVFRTYLHSGSWVPSCFHLRAHVLLDWIWQDSDLPPFRAGALCGTERGSIRWPWMCACALRGFNALYTIDTVLSHRFHQRTCFFLSVRVFFVCVCLTQLGKG